MIVRKSPISTGHAFDHQSNAPSPVKKIVGPSQASRLLLEAPLVSFTSTQPLNSKATSMRNNTMPMPARPAKASSLTATN
ncbi:hypothetical protein D3C81_1768540 [compost metagenome]